ncbi:Crp/Fnr family transcriptional regulator [Fundicoccus sp. Sow4_D5]|uniref:Crp/Fnr family transcriptional regulator n=1 Tax=unclassified Fundicoccus TaxID=2761543 RepID=UPI003F911671
MDFSQYHHCISTMPLFQSLSVEQIELIQAQIIERDFATGDLIHREGDEADTLYLVQKGQIRMFRLATSGKEQHLRVLEAGDFVGVPALFAHRHYEYFVEATEETTVCCIQRETFKDLLLSNPQIALELLSVLSERLEESEQQTTWITSESVQSRLANYLLEEAARQATTTITLTSTKKNIASFLGMSPESFSRGLGKLTRAGLVKQPKPNRLEILDQTGLKQLTYQA